jgi:hypothetical protein
MLEVSISIKESLEKILKHTIITLS